MGRHSLTIFRDFAEDHRTSMDVYADNLIRALNKTVGDDFNVIDHAPVVPSWVNWLPEKFNLRMRMARYVAYPLQARGAQSSINHIVDHGYGHLVNSLPSGSTVVTVHDLIPLLAWLGKIPGMNYPHDPRLSRYSLNALHKATCVISDSHSTKNDLIEYVGLEPSKIEVIHLGIDERFKLLSEESRRRARQRFDLPDSNTHIILITGQQVYKNHQTCLRVIERLQSICKKPIQLVKLGAETPDWNTQLSQSTMHRKVKVLQGLTTEQLIELYNSVDCLLFPSWYEGFGWPPLEAMTCGLPVVTSNKGSLLEVVGDAALTAAPDDVEALANAVLAMLENRNLRNQYIERGFNNIKRFSWQQYGKDIARIYRNVISKQN